MHTIIFENHIGGHFLDWSIFYLSGHKEFWNTEKSNFLSVINNPLTAINAHDHKSNQIVEENDIDFFYKDIEKYQNLNNFSIIFHRVYSVIEENNKLHWGKDLTSDIIKKIDDFPDNKIIVLKQLPWNILYNFVYTLRCGEIKKGSFIGANTESLPFIDAFIENFFSEKYKLWESRNLTNVWDKREFIALNLNPFDKEFSLEKSLKGVQFDYFPIVDQELWTSLDSVIPNLFNFLERDIDKSRFENWKRVYIEWKKLHVNSMRFCWYFDEIIDAILSNRHINLESFNLDLMQEAAIQHVLLYKHNLNFKTWKLEKFKDTKQLHNLLESNFHF